MLSDTGSSRQAFAVPVAVPVPSPRRLCFLLHSDSAVIRILAGALLAATSFAADDGWSKVTALRSGTEIRVFRRDAKEPIAAKMDEANDERIVPLAIKGLQQP